MAEFSEDNDRQREIETKRADRKARKEFQDPDGGVGSQTLSYTFTNIAPVVIEEDWSGTGSGLAGMQWLGGVALSRFFDERFPVGYFEGKRVLEVGAGCGLTSICLNKLGAHVTCTDCDISKAVSLISPCAHIFFELGDRYWNLQGSEHRAQQLRYGAHEPPSP